jgi:hypothetical protein
MRLSRQLSGLFCVVVFASFGRVQAADAPRRENPSPPVHTTEAPAYPLVIRIDHSALDPWEARTINHRSDVDSVVLRRIADVSVDDGWFILGLQNETAESPPAASTLQAASN